MRIAVVGLGGVGGFLGGKIGYVHQARDDHELYFVARGAHLEAIRRSGLRLVTGGRILEVRPKAAAERPAGWPVMDLVLLCVKGYDLETAVRTIAPCVGQETVLLPLQNGIEKRQRVEKISERGRVADGCIYVSAHIREPGTVEHTGGPGRVVLGGDPGDRPLLESVCALLQTASVPTEMADSVEVEVWRKYLFICALAGATALYKEPLGPILQDERKRHVLEGLMREVEILARRKGIALNEEIVQESLRICSTFPPGTKSSLLRDLEEGRPNELEWLLGTLLDQGERCGLSLPLARRVYRGIHKAWGMAPKRSQPSNGSIGD
jgi:2-dehydropantoate 2-reductase